MTYLLPYNTRDLPYCVFGMCVGLGGVVLGGVGWVVLWGVGLMVLYCVGLWCGCVCGVWLWWIDG